MLKCIAPKRHTRKQINTKLPKYLSTDGRKREANKPKDFERNKIF
jgi:hypothetical protein